MTPISDSDFRLLLSKLPEVLGKARGAIPSSDVRTHNSLRLLSNMTQKLIRQSKKK